MITAATIIRAPRAEVWRLTRDPVQHARWDLRFSLIEQVSAPGVTPERFRYVTRLGFGIAVEGWGETVGDSGHATSALRFGSDDPKALIATGSGSWTFHDRDEGTDFRTAFDYLPRYGPLGRMIDRLAFRPLMTWAVRWSFDRLRLWLETGTPPETLLLLWLVTWLTRIALGMVWFLEGLLPKLLHPTPEEIELVARGLPSGVPADSVVTVLGVLQCLFGLWLLSGRARRLTALLSTMGVLAATVLVTLIDPVAWMHYYGGIVKNLAFLAAGITVWLLTPLCPRATKPWPAA